MATTVEDVLKALDEWEYPVSRVRLTLDSNGEIVCVEIDAAQGKEEVADG